MALDSQPVCAPALRVVRAGPTFRGKQGHIHASALSAASVVTKAIHMQMLTVPPGEVGRAHLHERHETAIYILSGEYVYIPAGMPHMPYN